ncbi:hydroxymethylglutaryl-CoA lyase [Portibacter lacus]|uniref:Hydroxymethylglutaryl-CoA lyase n=2 Tax=Portibacter lacus TaxID=1099794 RepID=A0AA37SQT0_9BACT|nr:hydroxymethylglutaryl-CoA lyase [Portibacter lacus]GLR18347.1 hydroxymethylglutaryl-CoA lyase [Portibacter lacus]
MKSKAKKVYKIVECPRDAMQGMKGYIPAELKAAYINQLLKVGYHTIDFGSFVSPKAIPQMRDTAEVLGMLDLEKTKSKLLAIVANERGARDACTFEEIDFLGYPFSISETFQQRNTNSSIEQSLVRVEQIQSLASKHNKSVVIYISMGFGNPYGDPWNVEICQKWVDVLADMDIKIIALSDTIGVANPNSIKYLFSNLIPPYPDVEFGAHLHTQAHNWHEKVEAADLAGCKRFDSAIKGYGGCPMAKDDLTGNMATENVLSYFKEQGKDLNLNDSAFEKALEMSAGIFPL